MSNLIDWDYYKKCVIYKFYAWTEQLVLVMSVNEKNETRIEGRANHVTINLRKSYHNGQGVYHVYWRMPLLFYSLYLLPRLQMFHPSCNHSNMWIKWGLNLLGRLLISLFNLNNLHVSTTDIQSFLITSWKEDNLIIPAAWEHCCLPQKWIAHRIQLSYDLHDFQSSDLALRKLPDTPDHILKWI